MALQLEAAYERLYRCLCLCAGWRSWRPWLYSWKRPTSASTDVCVCVQAGDHGGHGSTAGSGLRAPLQMFVSVCRLEIMEAMALQLEAAYERLYRCLCLCAGW